MHQAYLIPIISCLFFVVVDGYMSNLVFDDLDLRDEIVGQNACSFFFRSIQDGNVKLLVCLNLSTDILWGLLVVVVKMMAEEQVTGLHLIADLCKLAVSVEEVLWDALVQVEDLVFLRE